MEKIFQKVAIPSIEGGYAENVVNLLTIYQKLIKGQYGASAEYLQWEVLFNILNLARLGKIDIERFSIVDYGCRRTTLVNVIAMTLSKVSRQVSIMLAKKLDLIEIMNFIEPTLSEISSQKWEHISQEEVYGSIVARRYDASVPEFSAPLQEKSDIVICLDWFEHLPKRYLGAFVKELETIGRYLIGNVFLRPAVNYATFSKAALLKGAVWVKTPSEESILLEQEGENYLFPLHLTILKQEEWMKILGEGYFSLPGPDWTAFFVYNFYPGEDFKLLKEKAIERKGWVDYIPLPVRLFSKYEKEKNPLLFEKVIRMQHLKWQLLLDTLKNYSPGFFRKLWEDQAKLWLAFIGDNEEEGVEKLYALEALSKEGFNSDGEVAEMAQLIVEDYLKGGSYKKAIDGWVA